MTWVVDGRTFAKKVKNPAHGACGHGEIITCPSCGYTFDQSNRTPEWPGLPVGVKFDPSDQELLEHLAAQIGLNGLKPHPFIDEFIPTLNGDDGICYTHPEKFPGIRCDGSSIHFFHRPSQAYMTGTRKRRKIPSAENSEGTGEVRWHKTGKTRPVLDNGRQLGCKKIMVLYVSFGKKAKPDKTNWVMHQYHLGEQEEEKNGELVVSKVFYQTQPRQLGLVRKGEDDDLQPAPLELTEGPAPSCPQTGTSTTSIDAHATPSAPKTPGSAPLQMAKRHKGLLGDITEEVERLSASMSVNFIKTGQSPEQSIGFHSANDYCQVYKRSESVGFNSANDYCQVFRNENPLRQGSSTPIEDTGCSAEPRELPNFYEQSIYEVQPVSQIQPISEGQVGNNFSSDNQEIMQVDDTCSMRSLSLPSVDAKMMSLLCSEQIQTAVNQGVPAHEQKTVGAETSLGEAIPSHHNSLANVGQFHDMQGAERWEHGVLPSHDAMVVNPGETEVVGQQHADQTGQDGGYRPDSFSLDTLLNSDFSLQAFFGERFVNTQDMIDMKLNSLSSQELSQDFLKQFPDSQEALLDFIGKLRDSQKSEDDNTGDKPT